MLLSIPWRGETLGGIAQKAVNTNEIDTTGKYETVLEDIMQALRVRSGYEDHLDLCLVSCDIISEAHRF